MDDYSSTVVGSQIQRALNEAISDQILPQIQATLRSGQKQMLERKREVPVRGQGCRSEKALDRRFKSNSKDEFSMFPNLQSTHDRWGCLWWNFQRFLDHFLWSPKSSSKKSLVLFDTSIILSLSILDFVLKDVLPIVVIKRTCWIWNSKMCVLILNFLLVEIHLRFAGCWKWTYTLLNLIYSLLKLKFKRCCNTWLSPTWRCRQGCNDALPPIGTVTFGLAVRSNCNCK